MLFASISFPPAQDLDMVIWNTSPHGRSGCSNLKTVTGKSPGRPAETRMALNLPVNNEQVSRRSLIISFLKGTRGQDSYHDMPSRKRQLGQRAKVVNPVQSKR